MHFEINSVISEHILKWIYERDEGAFHILTDIEKIIKLAIKCLLTVNSLRITFPTQLPPTTPPQSPPSPPPPSPPPPPPPPSSPSTAPRREEEEEEEEGEEEEDEGGKAQTIKTIIVLTGAVNVCPGLNNSTLPPTPFYYGTGIGTITATSATLTATPAPTPIPTPTPTRTPSPTPLFGFSTI
uniref:Uncharacterized protein n=1 Tax=Glossina palpalis gambiensis TaxID=67801 RepID=A0A1B0AYB7_9MUSC